MRLTPARLALLALVVVTALAWSPVATWLAADACVDVGGSYDYVLSRCDHTQTHPGPGSIFSSSGMRAPIVVGAVAIALLMLAFIRQDRRRPPAAR